MAASDRQRNDRLFVTSSQKRIGSFRPKTGQAVGVNWWKTERPLSAHPPANSTTSQN
jgi:hypothetical protein